jgi:hypothetical protein
MSKFSLIVVRVVSWFLLTFAFFAMGSLSNVKAASTDEQYPPNAEPSAQEMESALPKEAPGETLAYFFPSDNDATATVIFLLNTDSVDHIVPLRGYSFNGVLVYSLNINLPATSMRRLASDSIAAAPPPSWVGPSHGNPNGVDPIITNFTDFTYFASLSLPKGVRVDGYTLFNPGTGVVDPRQDQGAIPLRFMITSKRSSVILFLD